MDGRDVMKVKCLHCNQNIDMPEVKGIRYTLWPVIHDECYKAIEQEYRDNLLLSAGKLMRGEDL